MTKSGSVINWPSGSGSEILTDPQLWIIGDQMFNDNVSITLLLNNFFLDGSKRSREAVSLFEPGEINQ
jgi:hypothetical protein